MTDPDASTAPGPEPYVLALDQGTTGTRTLVLNREAAVVGEAYATHEQHYPRPGWVEHDASEILATARRLLLAAVEDAGVAVADVAALGLTNQRETVVVWDRATGAPVDRAIVWQDRRTEQRMETLPADLREYARERTGLRPDPYFSASKLERLLDVDDRRRRARDGELLAGTIDAWLCWQLTGTHATDVTNAARTMLFDIETLAYDERLCEAFGVPETCLPTVRPSGAAFGTVSIDDGTVPLRGMAGDQHAALIGQVGFEPGAIKATHGTGSFVVMNAGQDRPHSEHGLLETIAYQLPGEEVRYALEGSVFTTGAAVEWLADVGLLEAPSDVERLARSVAGPDGVYLVPAFQGLGAPHWDGRARGTILGVTRSTRPAHLARATLEAIAFQTRDVLTAMVDDTGLSVDRLRVDGGASDNDLLCALQAAATRTPVERPAVIETTAVGAAFLAGLAGDVWADRAALRRRWQPDRTFGVPDADATAADTPTDGADGRPLADRADRWAEAVDRARDWARD